jgi:hypothetical protein
MAKREQTFQKAAQKRKAEQRARAANKAEKSKAPKREPSKHSGRTKRRSAE